MWDHLSIACFYFGHLPIGWHRSYIYCELCGQLLYSGKSSRQIASIKRVLYPKTTTGQSES